MEVTIERAAVEDGPEILALQKAAYRSEAEIYNDFSIEPLTQTLESITEQFSNHIILKAVYENRIVGSVRACCEGDNVYIGKLIVEPQLQGRGIGKQLMKAIESEYENKTFILYTGDKSVKNIGFYTRLGYEAFDEKQVQSNLKLIYMRKVKR